MDPEVVATPEAPKPTAPLADRMKADLQEMLAGDAEGTDTEETPTEVDEGSTEPTADTKAGSDEDDESTTEKDGEADAPAEGEKTKPNRYQRQKAKYEAQVAVAAKETKVARGEAHEALHIANQWRAEALALREEFKRVVDTHGVQLDPRDVELFSARRSLAAQQMATEMQKARLTKEQQKAANEQMNQMAAGYQEQAADLAKKYPGLSAKDILNGYAAAVETEEDVSLDYVAEVLAQVKKLPARARAEKEQLRANAEAPRTIKPNKGPPPKYGNDIAGWKAHLVASGLA